MLIKHARPPLQSFVEALNKKNGFEKKTDLVGAELLFDVTAGGRTANFCEHRASNAARDLYYIFI